MSALGHKRTFAPQKVMSVSPQNRTSVHTNGMSSKGQADIRESLRPAVARRDILTDSAQLVALARLAGPLRAYRQEHVTAFSPRLVCVIDMFVESSPSGNARIGMRVHPGNNFWPNYGPCFAPNQNP